jgi:hypothetical protein
MMAFDKFCFNNFSGEKPIVPKPKTPSLQDRELNLEQTVNKAHEIATKTKAEFNFVVDEVTYY